MYFRTGKLARVMCYSGTVPLYNQKAMQVHLGMFWYTRVHTWIHGSVADFGRMGISCLYLDFYTGIW